MIAKVIIIYAAVSLWAFASYAQESNDNMLYTKKAESALETKRTGATLTILGGLALVTGAVILNSTSLNTGAAITTAGLVTTAIGLPIWIVGSNNHKKYTKKAQALSVRFNITPRQHGLSLSYRF